jgi:hypothetical protein
VNLSDLMERHLPAPPDPLPERNSEADYLWRATLFNAQQSKVRRIVNLCPSVTITYQFPSMNALIPIIRVECDELGRGVRVL